MLKAEIFIALQNLATRKQNPPRPKSFLARVLTNVANAMFIERNLFREREQRLAGSESKLQCQAEVIPLGDMKTKTDVSIPRQPTSDHSSGLVPNYVLFLAHD